MAGQPAQFGYVSGQMFIPLNQGMPPYYYDKRNGQYYQVTPADCNSWAPHLGSVQACVWLNGQYQSLPEGAYFQFQMPQQNMYPTFPPQGGQPIYNPYAPTIASPRYSYPISPSYQPPGYSNPSSAPVSSGYQSSDTIQPTYPNPFWPSSQSSAVYPAGPMPGPAQQRDAFVQPPVFGPNVRQEVTINPVLPIDVPVRPSKPLIQKPLVKQVKCSNCDQLSDFTYTISKKAFCLQCLKERIVSGEMYTGEGAGRKDWSALTIFEIYNLLVEKLPAEEKSTLPQSIPLPCDEILCIGRNEFVAPGYPPQGHMIGLGNKCTGEACPDPKHVLCKTCAKNLLECPLCHAFIQYEESQSNPDCKSHCGSFTIPCATCKKTDVRKKQRKPEEGKREEVQGKHEEDPAKPEEVPAPPQDVKAKEVVQGKLEEGEIKEKPKAEEVKVEEKKE